jgi:cytochrome c
VNRTFVAIAAGIVLAEGLIAWQGATVLADPVRGEQLFEYCSACHSVVPGEILTGPSLHGVIGRRAGTLPGFQYTEAMKKAGAERGIVWTRENLNVFLTDPDAFVPGTEMSFTGFNTAEERRDVIDYLEKSAATGGPAR